MKPNTDAELWNRRQFLIACKNQEILDADGYGYLATEIGEGGGIVYDGTRAYPSDIRNQGIPSRYTHVLWIPMLNTQRFLGRE